MNRIIEMSSSERALLLVTKKFAQTFYLNSNIRSKLFGTPTAAGKAIKAFYHHLQIFSSYGMNKINLALSYFQFKTPAISHTHGLLLVTKKFAFNLYFP